MLAYSSTEQGKLQEQYSYFKLQHKSVTYQRNRSWFFSSYIPVTYTDCLNPVCHHCSGISAVLRTEKLQTSYACALGDLSVHSGAPPSLKSFRFLPTNFYPVLSRALSARGHLGWDSHSPWDCSELMGREEDLVSLLSLFHIGFSRLEACLELSAQSKLHVCLQEQCCRDQSGPEEGAETLLGSGCPDKLGWNSWNRNQTMKNKPFPAAGGELPWVPALSFPQLLCFAAELYASPQSSIDCLFNLKPKQHTAMPRREPAMFSWVPVMQPCSSIQPFGQLSKGSSAFSCTNRDLEGNAGGSAEPRMR